VFYLTEKAMGGQVSLVLLLGNIITTLGISFYKYLYLKNTILPENFKSLNLLDIVPFLCIAVSLLMLLILSRFKKYE
jgi:hypothetical protein